MQGPFKVVQGFDAVIFRLPIFIPNVSANETFGAPHQVHNCSVCDGPLEAQPASCDVCYNTKMRSKFWGFVAVVVNVDELKAGTDGRLKKLTDLGYNYALYAPQVGAWPTPVRRVIHPPIAHTVSTRACAHVCARTHARTQKKQTHTLKHTYAYPHLPMQPDGSTTLVVQTPSAPVDAVVTTVQLPTSDPDTYWRLYVAPASGWVPWWRTPMIVVVTLLSLALGLLAFGIWVNRLRLVAALAELQVGARREAVDMPSPLVCACTQAGACALTALTPCGPGSCSGVLISALALPTQRHPLQKTNKALADEKERMDVLLARQYDLICCALGQQQQQKDEIRRARAAAAAAERSMPTTTCNSQLAPTEEALGEYSGLLQALGNVLDGWHSHHAARIGAFLGQFGHQWLS